MSIQFLPNKFSLMDEILQGFYNGIKPHSEFLIGAELERINVLKSSFEAVPYCMIENFLQIFSEKYNWRKIFVDNNLLGLEKAGHLISLEPGSQLELSVAPSENIHQIKDFTFAFNSTSSKLADELGFYFLGYGIQPVSTFEKIRIIPKERYSLMTDYFASKGALAYVMMRETAGCQVTLDYSSEDDAMRKLRLGMLLAPVVSSIFANSPIRGGNHTEYQSFRAKSWLFVDDDRCGFVSQKLIEEEFSFEDYVESLFDVPMIFINRGERNFKIPRTFREFVKEGYQGLQATLEDFQLHANLFFPEVRLKNFLEFRNADAQNPMLSLAIMALYKGIFYDEECMKKVENLFKYTDFAALSKMRNHAPLSGLQTQINGIKMLEFALKIIQFAKKSLQRQGCLNKSDKDESVYLKILEEYTLQAKTPADRLLETCGNDISKLVEYTKLS